MGGPVGSPKLQLVASARRPPSRPKPRGLVKKGIETEGQLPDGDALPTSAAAEEDEDDNVPLTKLRAQAEKEISQAKAKRNENEGEKEKNEKAKGCPNEEAK